MIVLANIALKQKNYNDKFQNCRGKFRDTKLVLVTLINIQEMVAKGMQVRDTKLHRELELLDKAVVKHRMNS